MARNEMLRAAVNLINTTQRPLLAAAILAYVENCVRCEEDFVLLPQDRSMLVRAAMKNNGELRPVCQMCVRADRAERRRKK